MAYVDMVARDLMIATVRRGARSSLSFAPSIHSY